MKTAVMGAGAVGGYYGGMLARAGCPVVLIGRGAFVDAVRRDGLRLQTRQFDQRVAVDASADAADAAGADLVLVCVKSTDSEAAAAALKPHLKAEALVLSLQNGVDNADRLAQVLGRAVEPAVVYVATEMAGPGHVLHHGRGELVVGAGAAHLKPTFELAGVPIVLSDNVRGALWSKLILNCAYNALSAITRLPYGVLKPFDGVDAVMRDVVAECVAVAQADGVTLAEPPWPAVERIAQTMPAQFSSTAQDLMRGKRSEIDHLNGFVLRRGEARGVPTPVNRVLHTLVRLLETHPAQTAAR